MEKVKDNVVKSYNKDLYNMMNRDSSFNIKMKKLGYKLTHKKESSGGYIG